MLASFLIPLALSVAALTNPLKRADPIPACQYYPSNGSGDVGIFTLVAVFDDDSSQKSLVLGNNGNDSASTFFLGTSDTIENNHGAGFVMNGGVISTLSMGAGGSTTGAAVDDDAFVPFSANATPAPIYCRVASTSPHGSTLPGPALAVNGGTEGFSVCRSTGSSQDLVVFGVIPWAAFGYDASTCRRVHIALLEQY